MNLPRPKSIFARIFLTALLPVMLLAVLLSSYAINARLDDLAAAHAARGNAQAQQLASLAVIGLFNGDSAQLRRASEQLLASSDDVRRVEIRDRDRAIVAEAQRTTGSPQALTVYSARVSAPVIDLDEAGGSPGDAAALGEVSVHLSGQALAQARQRVLRKAVVTTLISVVLALLLTAIVARQIVRPIDELRDAVDRVQRGERDTRIEHLSSGELGELQSGFNAMSQQIASSAQNLQRQVEQATADLRGAMSELEQKNADLEHARRREREANRAKSVFLANMSHEIRTPMNGVLGFAGLLQKTPLDSTQQEFLDTITRSANQLLTIINDILDFSEMEAGRLRLERVAFDARDAIEDACELLTPQAHEKGLDLIPVIEADVPERLLGDVTRLRHVLTNLVGNAVKFTDRGEVVVQARLDVSDSECCVLLIDVSDTGVGIDPAAIETLFQPFCQGPASTRRLYGGTGLGLSISRSLVEAMDGSIEVTSTPGQGSCFHVRLPFDIEVTEDAGDRHAPPASRGAAVVIDEHALSGPALAGMLDRAGFSTTLHSRVPAAVDRPEPALYLLRCPVDASQNLVRRALSALRRLSPAPIGVLLPRLDPALTRFVEHHPGCFVQAYPARRRSLLAAIDAMQGTARENGARLSSTPEASDGWLAGHTILIADDNTINRRLIDALLRGFGASPLLAHDGDEVLEIARNEVVELLLLDIHMPGRSGLDAARALRRQPAYAHVPMIALTADAGMPAEHGEGAGLFDAWLVKPVHEAQLHAVLRRLLPQRVERRIEAGPGPAVSGEDGPAARDRRRATAIAGGDESVADSLFDELLAALPDSLAQLRSQYDERELDAMWQTVHKLQGSVAACAATALGKALDRLQQAVMQQDATAIAAALGKVQNEADRLVADAARRGRDRRA
ncbi:MAG: response regulator [Gammaproteobacteria bacterium]|nr:response regulator [Gammaproteobacteria bacterium]